MAVACGFSSYWCFFRALLQEALCKTFLEDVSVRPICRGVISKLWYDLFGENQYLRSFPIIRRNASLEPTLVTEAFVFQSLEWKVRNCSKEISVSGLSGNLENDFSVCVCVCVFFPFILDIKFVRRTSRGHTGGRSHRISHPPSRCVP